MQLFRIEGKVELRKMNATIKASQKKAAYKGRHNLKDLGDMIENRYVLAVWFIDIAISILKSGGYKYTI